MKQALKLMVILVISSIMIPLIAVYFCKIFVYITDILSKMTVV